MYGAAIFVAALFVAMTFRTDEPIAEDPPQAGHVRE